MQNWWADTALSQETLAAQRRPRVFAPARAQRTCVAGAAPPTPRPLPPPP